MLNATLLVSVGNLPDTEVDSSSRRYRRSVL
jgi:hypothetical protein